MAAKSTKRTKPTLTAHESDLVLDTLRAAGVGADILTTVESLIMPGGKKRGRPAKNPTDHIDFKRAIMVEHIEKTHPGITRSEAIQLAAELAAAAKRGAKDEDWLAEMCTESENFNRENYIRVAAELAELFPDRELNSSVSRGTKSRRELDAVLRKIQNHLSSND